VRAEPTKLELKAPGIKPLTLRFDEALSTFAFKFNLRRYSKAVPDSITANQVRWVVTVPAIW
jgi:hypothetical protein